MLAIIGAIMGIVGVLGVIATLFSLPGIWLIVSTGIVVDLIKPETFSLTTLLVAVGAGLLAEIVEFVAAGAGAKQAGGTKRSSFGAIIGAVVGAIVGTPFFPIIGTIVGGVLGAGVGAMLMERTRDERTWGQTWRVGQGAAIGRLVATIIKAGFAIAIAVYLTVAAVM